MGEKLDFYAAPKMGNGVAEGDAILELITASWHGIGEMIAAKCFVLYLAEALSICFWVCCPFYFGCCRSNDQCPLFGAYKLANFIVLLGVGS